MKANQNKLTDFEEKLFEPYCLDEDYYRPQLRHPFVDGDYITATDSHVLLRVRRDLLSGKYEAREHMPSSSKIMPADNYDGIITFDVLRSCIKKVCTEDEEILVSPAVKCEECNDFGEVEWEYEDKDHNTHYAYHDCPICNGTGLVREAVYKKTGRKEPRYDCAVRVNGVQFSALYIMVLYRTMELLGLDHITHTCRQEGNPNTFHFTDGIDAVIMPLNEGYTEGYIITSPNTK